MEAISIDNKDQPAYAHIRLEDYIHAVENSLRRVQETLILLCGKVFLGESDTMDITLTDKNFDKEVIQSNRPVLVDFWAVWCGPCQIQGPILEEVAKLMEGKAIVGKLNVDENAASAQKYGIMSIPTIMIFKGGTVVKQFMGVQSKETLVGELNKLLN